AGVMVLLMPRMASSAIVTIGSEPGCDYVATGANNPIAQALTDGHDDLRVTVDMLNVGAAGVFVSDARPQVSIRGGYANCAAAAAGTAPPIAARSRWQGASGQSLFAALSFGP